MFVESCRGKSSVLENIVGRKCCFVLPPTHMLKQNECR